MGERLKGARSVITPCFVLLYFLYFTIMLEAHIDHSPDLRMQLFRQILFLASISSIRLDVFNLSLLALLFCFVC
jgi:hypothetical protein